jgi:hypothetical protein
MNPKIAELLNDLEEIRSGNAEKNIQSQLDAIATEQAGHPSHMNERGTIFTAQPDGSYTVTGYAGTITLTWDDIRTMALTSTVNGHVRYYYAWDIDTGDRKRRPYRHSGKAVQLAGAKLFEGVQRARDIAQAAALDALKTNGYDVEYIGGAGWIAKQNGEWISRGGAMNERTAWDQCRVHLNQQAIE